MYSTFVVQTSKDRYRVFGFRKFEDFLKALPCRQSIFNSNFQWPYSNMIADCATIESARKVIPDGASQLTK